MDSTPFLWLADSWWHGMTSRFSWPDDFQFLVRDRKEKGFSVIQFAIGFPCDVEEFDPRGANEAGFPLSKTYDRINPEYFDLTDLRIKHFVDQGLVPNILGSWGYYLPWFGIGKMKKYWRYIIARYAAYPICWTIAGETTLVYYLSPPDKKQELLDFQRKGWSEIARYVKSTDPYHRILTAHPGPASGHFEPISDPEVLDIIMVQPGHSGWNVLPTSLDHLRQAQTKFTQIPAMQGEVCFEGMMGGGCDAKLQRLLFWMNMFSGAVGHCYGADAIWQFNTEEYLFGPSPNGHVWGNHPWKEACHWKGAYYVGLGGKILSNYDWQNFKPWPESISPAAENGHHMDAYAFTKDDHVRLCYFPKGVMPWGQKYKLMKLDPEARYKVTYLDPLSGDRYEIAKMIEKRKEWEIPPAPILQDWLLEVRKIRY